MAGSGFPESGRGQIKLQVGKVTGGRAVNDLLRFSSLMLSCCNLFGSEQVQALSERSSVRLEPLHGTGSSDRGA